MLLARLRGLIRRDVIAEEIREELESHLRDRTEQYEREGLRPADAARRARVRVGNLAVHRDVGYDVRGGGVVEAILRDLKWAWRGVLVRGWRAVFMVGLLGVTLAANAVSFSAADAFVFRAVPYADPGRLVVIERTSSMVGRNDYMWRDHMLAWRSQRDLFAGIEGYESGSYAYLTSNGVTDLVRGERVTPGTFALLGVMPEHGRSLAEADAVPGTPPVAVIGHALAVRLFGRAQAAIGQTFPTDEHTLAVVGVMPASFRFPTAREEFWQPLDLAHWPDRTGLRHVARLAAGQSVATAAPIVTAQLPAVLGAEARRLRTETMTLRTLADFRDNGSGTAVFGVLLAAAACLLLIACANLASLELAAAGRRMRVYAIQTALGASRTSLIRVALFDATLLIIASAGVALVLTVWGSGMLSDQLTGAMRDALANPLDVDGRVVGFMFVTAAATWLLTAIPVVLRVSRASVLSGLRDDPRVMPVSHASVRIRQTLMTGQVALTVLLLVGALLYIRTYQAKVGRAIGLDVSRVATIGVSPAPDAAIGKADLEAAVIDRLRTASGVVAFSRTGMLPPSTQAGGMGQIKINGATESAGKVMVSFYDVDPDYFRTMGVPVVRGRLFDASSPRESVVVDEAFAKKYWPGGEAVGSRFRVGGMGVGDVSEFLVVGVSRELRADRTVTASGENVFVAYIRMSPTSHPLTFVAKLDDERRIDALTAVVRSVTGRSIVRVDTVEARYAKLEGDTRLTAAVTAGFSTMALLIATSGIYAVMAFLVAGRSREIGIRMALGADRSDVRWMIFASALRFVAAGAALGLGAAALLSRAITAQLFGVSPTDPLTYAAVAALVVLTAMAATWWPARRAARVDPAITLRSE